MYKQEDIDAAVEQRKFEILLETPIGRRLIRTEIINCYVNVGYSYADSAILFDLINQGMIKNVCIGVSQYDAL